MTGADATEAQKMVDSYNNEIEAVQQLTGTTNQNTTATKEQQNAIEGLQKHLHRPLTQCQRCLVILMNIMKKDI